MAKLVVVASDGYVDAVPLFFRALDRFWPTCNMRRELIYCNVPPDLHDTNIPLNGIIKLGIDRGWIANMLRYTDAEFGREQPFLLMLEDYLICDVDEALMGLAERMLAHDDVAMIRVRATPGPTLPWPIDGVGEIDKEADYSVSLQATIWRPEAFATLLRAVYAVGGRSAWDLELKGSKLLSALNLGHFLSLESSGLAYRNLYRRGRKVADVVEWAEKTLEG